MGHPGKKTCSDEEFIRLWRELGSPRLVAKALGLDERSVYLRRNNIEKNHKVHLAAGETPNDYLHRLTIDGFDGRMLVFSDAHIWPNRPRTLAHRAMMEVIKDIKPKLVIANGDIFDGARLSRFPRNGWEEQPRVADELEAAMEQMNEIRHACRSAQLIRTIGNHDIRFDRYLATNAGEMEGVHGARLADHLPAWRECVSVAINGHCMVKHRYRGGIHSGYRNTLEAGWSTFTGHTHLLEVKPWSDYNGRRYGVSTGSLADVGGPQFAYTEDAPTPWCSGFATGRFDKAGRLLPPLLCEVRNGEAIYMDQVVVSERRQVAA